MKSHEQNCYNLKDSGRYELDWSCTKNIWNTEEEGKQREGCFTVDDKNFKVVLLPHFQLVLEYSDKSGHLQSTENKSQEIN